MRENNYFLFFLILFAKIVNEGLRIVRLIALGFARWKHLIWQEAPALDDVWFTKRLLFQN